MQVQNRGGQGHCPTNQLKPAHTCLSKHINKVKHAVITTVEMSASITALGAFPVYVSLPSLSLLTMKSQNGPAFCQEHYSLPKTPHLTHHLSANILWKLKESYVYVQINCIIFFVLNVLCK